YLAEFTYRANRRWIEASLFDRLIVAALDTKAVTCKELTAGAT
ncbi:MAG: IS1595 family transposase, partial [Planctomycetes bacterium]|nr:IS1595 family transposase [Planctomycetota bacterium]MBI3832865.1 IS1595 family transposase [Planctomycetota bacterium]MBI3833642.1 IS1595 family transposase [Planctomycetota bacterium]MBI3833918.1 IS1595 family transposase [Planctomycetota bacterium]MBI3835005.1 IS1595 family transposase [Planctomycetota bacterium]